MKKRNIDLVSEVKNWCYDQEYVHIVKIETSFNVSYKEAKEILIKLIEDGFLVVDEAFLRYKISEIYK